MIILPRVARFGPAWWPWVHSLRGEPPRVVPHFDGANITCGGCGRGIALCNHTIAADGTVSPSVVCPHPGCGWHVFLRLDGWPAG